MPLEDHSSNKGSPLPKAQKPRAGGSERSVTLETQKKCELLGSEHIPKQIRILLDETQSMNYWVLSTETKKINTSQL